MSPFELTFSCALLLSRLNIHFGAEQAARPLARRPYFPNQNIATAIAAVNRPIDDTVETRQRGTPRSIKIEKTL